MELRTLGISNEHSKKDICREQQAGTTCRKSVGGERIVWEDKGALGDGLGGGKGGLVTGAGGVETKYTYTSR